MISDVAGLVKQAERLFANRTGLMDLWQVIAENFYVERADFTEVRTEGDEFADHLFASYPVMARRELGNLFASNLRPRSVKWFALHAVDDKLDRHPDARAYLEYRTGVVWRAMYDAPAQFTTATKAADHDFATFGNTVLEIGLNRDRDGLLFRCAHLRDCAWMENADGVVDCMFQKWNPTAKQLVDQYGKEMVSKETAKKAEKSPEMKVECYRMSVPARTYMSARGNGRFGWTVLIVEKEGNHVLEETPERRFRFVVPRWHKVTGSQYARSPATEIALPDGRTFQVVVRTLREAGEMHVNPPMIGVTDALRSDAELYPGGLTAVDIEFDGELKNALAPVMQNASTMPIGFEIANALREDIRSGFFLDKIKLPDITSKVMTAFEFQKRLEEHVRASAPIFEPIEDEYNAPVVDAVHDILDSVGAFGPKENIPQVLSGARTEFKFRSPLRDVQDQAKAGLFGDVLERVVGPAAQVDPAQMANLNLMEAVQDSMRGLGVPASWIARPEAVAAAKAQLEEQKKMQAGMAALQQGGAAAKDITGAMANVNGSPNGA